MTMKVDKIIEELGCEVLAKGSAEEVCDGYTSDLLSDVMGNCPEGCLWITIQRHMNVIAVAQLKRVAGIIFGNGAKPDPNVIQKAEEEGIYLLSCRENAFQISGKVFAILNTSQE